MSKPADFMLGLLDFFGVLLPGTIATWLVLPHLPPDLRQAFDLENGSGTVPWIVFLFASYGLGHFVFGISSNLDGPYDAWRREAKRSNVPYERATEVREARTPDFVDGDFSTLKWARAFIRVQNPSACLEIDRLEATSKFFRSMVVVAGLSTLHFLLQDPNRGVAAGALLIGALSFWRFCDQRFKMTELAYATAIIIHATTEKRAAEKAGNAAAEDEAD